MAETLSPELLRSDLARVLAGPDAMTLEEAARLAGPEPVRGESIPTALPTPAPEIAP